MPSNVKNKIISLVFLLPFLGFLIGSREIKSWKLMWLISISLFLFCKWICYAFYPSIKGNIRYAWCYWLLWPGMDPRPFQVRSQKSLNKSKKYVYLGLLSLAMAWGLLRAVSELPAEWVLFRGWLTCAAIVFAMHFGLFHTLSWFLREMGFAVAPIMNFPLLAKSISEFWGVRWNMAFKQVVFPFVYEPAKRQWGARAAIFLTFLCSGVVHDLVISLPARAGWGLPTLYFMIQAIGLFIERTAGFRRFPRWLKRSFVYVVVVGPAWLLFHPAFLKNVIVPFAGALGCL